MLLPHSLMRRRVRLVLLSALGFAVAIWLVSGGGRGQRKKTPIDARLLEQQYPLVWNHIHSFDGVGGAWFIPPGWIADDQKPPENIVEAALLASKAALFARERQIAFSNIPLLLHQLGTSSNVLTWKPQLVPMVEQWLEESTTPTNGTPMAYFFWDDEGKAMLVDKYEKEFLEDFNALFTPVERADIIRILACQYFGGVYADIDTEPLRHPADWIGPSDLARWIDDITGKSYGFMKPEAEAAAQSAYGKQPVNLIWGLEADTDPNTNTYWRMGYTYPIQLTQWALASAPGHPALRQFMENLRAEVHLQKNATTYDPNRADPLTRTGPAAVTLATLLWLERDFGFRWNALTGLKDGGKSKLVADALILPITGFSPGRGSYGNMGSKPITDPDARLVHHALGSWRKFDLLVEYGKFCRTVFGLCKDWTKVPAPRPQFGL